jgi:hypothetical protein
MLDGIKFVIMVATRTVLCALLLFFITPMVMAGWLVIWIKHDFKEATDAIIALYVETLVLMYEFCVDK